MAKAQAAADAVLAVTALVGILEDTVGHFTLLERAEREGFLSTDRLREAQACIVRIKRGLELDGVREPTQEEAAYPEAVPALPPQGVTHIGAVKMTGRAKGFGRYAPPEAE